MTQEDWIRYLDRLVGDTPLQYKKYNSIACTVQHKKNNENIKVIKSVHT